MLFTRDRDIFVSLAARLRIIARSGAALLVEALRRRHEERFARPLRSCNVKFLSHRGVLSALRGGAAIYAPYRP